MEKWREYIRLQVSAEEIEQKWIPQHYDEDYPANLMSQLNWLQEMGFVEVELFGSITILRCMEGVSLPNNNPF